MRKRWVLAFLLTAAVGSAWHFLYDLFPNPLTALLAPVNESIWEHLKLTFWPFLAAAVVMTRREEDRQAAWSGFLLALLVMPLIVAAGYYLLRDGFGVSGMAVDIGLYIVAMALGFGIAARWRNGKWTGILIVLVSFFAVCLLLFSIQAPELPIFQPPQP